MVKFPAYGMAGVGIAAAVGFIFALSFLANYANDGDASPGLTQQQQELARTQPSSLFVQQQQNANGNGAAGDDAADNDGGDVSQDMTSARSMDSAENETAPGGGEGGESASLMMQQQSEEEAASSTLRPTLLSVIASDGSTGEIIGEVVPNMQFEAGKPVFIKAYLVNLNDTQISDNVIALGISSSDDQGEVGETGGGLEDGDSDGTLTQGLLYEQASSFRGDIGIGENVELELYWNHVRAGEYTLLLFSVAPRDLTFIAEPVDPIASIPIKVVEPTSSDSQ